ncbi:MAG: hypothetical protein SGCHY_004779 [Lobulomycetales sp.]
MAKKLVKEGLAEIMCDTSVFYNPVQEFNRDMSIAAINTWMSMLAPAKPQIKVLEGLAATGLRSMRYAKELIPPSDSSVLITANDFDANAVETIRESIIHNNVVDKVEASHGDANYILHKSAHDKNRFHVVDLDPYGSASQFLDAAVQAVEGGGLLCVTCTDMQVLAGGQTEVNFAKYGGVNLTNTPYCHEMALRSLLHALNVSALRYKRSITPLVSCSIDFYIRLFVRVDRSPKMTKLGASRTSMVYHCHTCTSFHTQPLGLIMENGKSVKYKTNRIPMPRATCENCGSPYTVAGPVYGGKLHDAEFVSKMVQHVKDSEEKYGTKARMTGMLSVIGEELEDSPFYYSLSAISKVLRVEMPKQKIFLSALLNAGYKTSLSHCQSSVIKTNAPPSVIWDIMRCHVKKGPAKERQEGTPGANILAVEPTLEANFALHPESEAASKKVKLVRYQENPTPNWGPKSKARKIAEE